MIKVDWIPNSQKISTLEISIYLTVFSLIFQYIQKDHGAKDVVCNQTLQMHRYG